MKDSAKVMEKSRGKEDCPWTWLPCFSLHWRYRRSLCVTSERFPLPIVCSPGKPHGNSVKAPCARGSPIRKPGAWLGPREAEAGGGPRLKCSWPSLKQLLMSVIRESLRSLRCPHGTDVKVKAESQLAEGQHFSWGLWLPF